MLVSEIFSIVVLNIICFVVIIIIIPIADIVVRLYQIRILIIESSDEVIYEAFPCRHFPILDKGCPIEFHMKYLFYHLDNRLTILIGSTIDSMQKVFSNAKTILSQGSYQF